VSIARLRSHCRSGPFWPHVVTPFQPLPGLSHDVPVEPRTNLLRITRTPLMHIGEFSSLSASPPASTPHYICLNVCWFVRFVSTEWPTSPHTPRRSRRYVAKDVMLVLPMSRTCVRLPSLLPHTLPIVDACQSVYGRPVVPTARACIYEVVFRLS
jgi:hypothetical protein